MRAIARFVGLDLRSMQPNAKYMIIPVAITGVPVLLFLGPYLLIPALASLAVVSAPSYLFGNDERGRLDTLYTVLGIPRRHVVAGRHATLLLLMIGLTIAGVLLGALSALIFGVAFEWRIVAGITIGSVALVGITLAAELPAYFGTGPGPVRTVAGIAPGFILSAIFVGWALPDVRTAVLSWLADANLAWLALAAITIVGVLLAASTAFSARLYAGRDL